MKKPLFLSIILIATMIIFSCKKDKNPPAPVTVPATTPANPLFIKFTLDGVAKSFTGTEVSIHTGYGGGSSTSSGFFNLKDDISINLSMPLDSIMGSDLQGLIGKKIPIGSCGGCPTNAHLDYDINGNEYESSDLHNALPSDYIQFNTVTFNKTVTKFDQTMNQYYITGEFNLKLSYGNDVKNATNGTFGLIFRESKH